MKHIFLPVFVAVIAFGSALSVQASEPDRYANRVVTSNYQFQSEGSILGAPDQLYTDARTAGASLKLDMGEHEAGLGDLTVFYEAHSAQVQLQFEFYDMNDTLVHSYGNFVPLQNSWVIAYPSQTPYRYVRINSRTSDTIRIDAIASASVVGVETEPEPTPEIPEVIDANPLHGSLVKLTNDWNDETDADTVVYLLDANNARHIIPNETVFTSWGLSFDDVTVIGSGTLTGMPFGKNVYVRPGSFLVKIERSSKVYAVEAGGILQWITTEELATKLYGADWKNRVVDVPETLFAQYTFGETLTEAKYVDGSFVKTPAGSTWFIGEEGKRYSIGPLTLEALHLSNSFLTTGMDEPGLASTHPYEGRLVYQDSQRWPF